MEKRMYFGQSESFMEAVAKGMDRCKSYDVYIDKYGFPTIVFNYKTGHIEKFCFDDTEQFKLFVSFITMFGFATEKGDIHQAIEVITG